MTVMTIAENIWVRLETLNTRRDSSKMRENHDDGDRTLLESHVLSILPLSPFLDTSSRGEKKGGVRGVELEYWGREGESERERAG